MPPLPRHTPALAHLDHRPWPTPRQPWAMSMRWHDLLFLHWPMTPAMLRPLIPGFLEIDTYEGVAWLGVVPFRMSAVRPRAVPAFKPLSDFPELNVRTYVTAHGKPGVWFFSLDAASPPAVEMARLFFHLPYFNADMTCQPDGEGVRYRSIRTHSGARPASFTASYRPTGPVARSAPGTLEHWLTERYCLYAANRRQNIWRSEIAHAHWPLQPAQADVTANSMSNQIGLRFPPIAPLAHFARLLEVVAWLPERIA